MSTIAIVDDTSAAAEAVACMLKVSGIRETKIFNSAEALLEEMDGGFRPDYIVSDFLMPGMNGVELLDTIAEKYGPVPGVIMTGNPEAIKTKSNRRPTHPVLCKGRSDFFFDLIALIGKKNYNGKRILSTEAQRRIYRKLALQC